ncbi:MAG: dephospho-CoA kinase [Xanthomonadales bacterium]|nr:dephospho-CoA kinase [Xanthomonadales bacterium]NIX13669.1 dephospho-CoA kinase [Xanthomonadales bacterium]
MIGGANGPVYVVALTGGIAAGKSSVARLFEKHGVPVIDTDEIAHQLVEPGQPLLSSIVGVFGKEMLDAYGRLRRRHLREIIFANPGKRAQLESMLHPRIGEEALRRIGLVSDPYCLLVIPLLAETGGQSGADRILVVDAEEKIRIRRLMERDGSTRSSALAALAAQSGREERLAIADDIIDNSGEKAELEARVAELHRRYTELARAARDSGASIPEG